MSSTYGSKAGAPLSYYSASKAAVEHLTRCWALEFAPKKIRVNAIASGTVETTFMQKQMGHIGTAHVCTPVTNAHIVFRLIHEKKQLASNNNERHNINIPTYQLHTY